MKFNKIVILGATGRIGSEISRLGTQYAHEIITVDRKTYQTWSEANLIEVYFKSIGLESGDIVVCASGIINPKEDTKSIELVNFVIPNLVCSMAADFGANAVTLGTILEEIIPEDAQNPYVKSKAALAKAANEKWLHLQLHTIYGGHAPDEFMFIGQALNSLKNGNRFSMTSGEQIREYHHVEDVSEAILNLAAETRTGCIDVSHGEYVSLRELAEAIFNHFGKAELLGIGDRASPSNEAFHPKFKKHPKLSNLNFRPTIPSLIQWLENHL